MKTDVIEHTLTREETKKLRWDSTQSTQATAVIARILHLHLGARPVLSQNGAHYYVNHTLLLCLARISSVWRLHKVLHPLRPDGGEHLPFSPRYTHPRAKHQHIQQISLPALAARLMDEVRLRRTMWGSLTLSGTAGTGTKITDSALPLSASECFWKPLKKQLLVKSVSLLCRRKSISILLPMCFPTGGERTPW